MLSQQHDKSKRKNTYAKYVYWVYLNLGIGKDCPKQSIDKDWSRLTILSCSRSPVKVGATLPTGSLYKQNNEPVKNK